MCATLVWIAGGLGPTVGDVRSDTSGDLCVLLRNYGMLKQHGFALADDLRYELRGKIDELQCDLESLRGGGGRVGLKPPEMVENLEDISQRLRKLRDAVSQRIEKLAKRHERFCQRLEGNFRGNVLTIENLEASRKRWFMVRSAQFMFDGGSVVHLTPRDFEGGEGYQVYAHKCPPAFAVWIYGGGRMSARFYLASKPSNAQLVIVGQQDGRGGQTRIRIVLNGKVVFEGGSDFVSEGWSERHFQVPTGAFVVGQAQAKEVLMALRKHERELDTQAEQLRKMVSEAVQPVTKLVRDKLSLLPPVPSPPFDFHKSHYVRGAYYHGIMPNVRLGAKMLRSADCNLVLSYLSWRGKEDLLSQLLSLADRMGLAVVDAVRTKETGWHFLHPERMESTLLNRIHKWREEHSSFVGFEFDEPGAWEGQFKGEEAKRAFASFLRRKHKLRRLLGHLPEALTPPSKITDRRTRILWVEWQLFKIATMRNYFQRLQRFCDAHRVGLYPIIVGCPFTRPQHASFYSIPSVVRTIAQGAYKTSSLNLTFLLELLRANALGRTYLCPGAGFSAPTPMKHERELSVAIPHADGVWLWCWIHQQPYWFRSTCSRPGLWEVTRRVFRKMASIEPYLVGAQSTARIALVYSERTGIVDSYGHRYGYEQPYYLNQLGLFWALLLLHRQCDVMFAEQLPTERIRRYKLLIISDARALTDEQLDALRKWVNTGGTVFVTADTSLCDEWGREESNYQLADLFGVSHLETRTGGKGFTFVKPFEKIPVGTRVVYDVHLPRTVVRKRKGETLAIWDDGSPAVVLNRYGHGRIIFCNASHLGLAYHGPRTTRELPGKFNEGVLSFLRGILAGVPLLVEGGQCPSGVEVCVRRQGKRFIIHMVNHRDVAPVRAKLRLCLPESEWRVFYPVDGQPVPCRLLPNGAIELHIRPFKVHEMVVLEPRQSTPLNAEAGARASSGREGSQGAKIGDPGSKECVRVYRSGAIRRPKKHATKSPSDYSASWGGNR